MKASLSETQLTALRANVEDAELGTPGEIVVVVVPKSSSYEAVLWRAAALGVILGAICWAIASIVWRGWGATWLWSPAFGPAISGVGAVVGAWIARRNGPIFRLLAGKTLLARRVRYRAQRTFLERGVAETRARTGILIFVSLLEHRIEVIGDKGITAAVAAGQWQEVVDVIRKRLSDGEMIQGLSDGIALCGEILRGSGLSEEGVDENELSDDVRFESD